MIAAAIAHPPKFHEPATCACIFYFEFITYPTKVPAIHVPIVLHALSLYMYMYMYMYVYVHDAIPVIPYNRHLEGKRKLAQSLRLQTTSSLPEVPVAMLLSLTPPETPRYIYERSI